MDGFTVGVTLLVEADSPEEAEQYVRGVLEVGDDAGKLEVAALSAGVPATLGLPAAE